MPIVFGIKVWTTS